MKWLKFIKRLPITKLLYKILFWLVGLLPADKRLIIFESYLGKQYSCNPRALYEYLLETNWDYKLLWSVDPRFAKYFEDHNIPYINRFSLKWLYYMARARYWISNSRLPIWIPKPKHTIYVQTWHGTPLKKLALDIEEVQMPNVKTNQYKKTFIKESSRWDYLISPNAYSTEIFRRAFKYEKEIIESGYPRNDYLIKNNNDKFINVKKKELGIPSNKKIILYAPTWRDDLFYSVGRYKFDLNLELDLMRKTLGEEYVLLLRMHYLIFEHLDVTDYEGFVYDFTDYEDIRDLYLISDVLITDYSSVFFDYAILKRPIIFYTFDIERYRSKIRGFYFDFEKLAPGPLVFTTEDIIKHIKEFEDKGFYLSKNNEMFLNKFFYLESGKSSQRVVERVFAERSSQ